MKKYAQGGELPQAMVDRMKREENKEDRELVAKPARAIAGAAKRMYDAATGKDAKDFEPKKLKAEVGGLSGSDSKNKGTYTADRAVSSPVGGEGSEIRSLNMGKKSKATKVEEFKKGGMIGSASKRADGCAIKGKTKGRMV
jgi:hypothetical protein